MDVQFECRFTENWEYQKQLYSYTRKKNKGLLIWWCCLCLFLVCMTVREFMTPTKVFAPVYLMITLFALWRGFGGPIRVRHRWKKVCAKAGTDQIESVFTFGDKVRISDSSGVAVEFEWPLFEKLYMLQGFGPYFRFEGSRRKGNLYLPRAAFEDGTGKAFTDWIKQNHPGLLRR